jgi:hypothetical protein
MRLPLTKLAFLCVLCVSVVNGFALDREAFTFTNYDLNLRLEPEQHRMGVRGKILLRNDSATPQNLAVLQISSSLDWRSIRVGGKPVQFLRQPYTSDIDHTGSLSEAIITLPRAIAPRETVEIEVAYEGVILPDATRLTRIGTPEDIAKSSDWDQIGENFTAVRGIGYVTWYPIATESANLSEDESLPQAIRRWKQRSAEARLSVIFQSTQPLTLVCSGDATPNEPSKSKLPAFTFQELNTFVPTFTLADYKNEEVENGSIAHLPGKEAMADVYAAVLRKLDPLGAGQGSRKLQVAELPDRNSVPFVTDGMLLMPLQSEVTPQDRLTLVYALARQQIRSPRTWVSEGLAHYAQVLDIEHQLGRKAAMDYMKAHLALLTHLEDPSQDSPSKKEDAQEGNQSLLAMTDDVALESKAMWVWWMLQDMIGANDPAVAMARILREYKPADDTDSSYVQKLLETAAHRDLKWFFDDWVYHDHGLPDFKIESVYPGKTSQGGFIVTITVDNLGTAGAEVPLIAKFPGGEIAKRVEVRANSKLVIRVETSAAPQEVTVNDGSVPESNLANNVFKLEPAQK